MSSARRLLVACTAGLAVGALVLHPGSASAHGERTQSPWVRTLTATFFDIEYSGGSGNQQDDIVVDVGERIRLKGRVQLAKEWPLPLGDIRVGYLTVNMPGPVLAVLDKQVNDKFAPGSIAVEPGDSFEFDIELAGRRPGRWHIHPRFDIAGQGPLLGPGQWVRVRTEGGPYRSPVQLASGKDIDLERFGLGHVAGWHAFWLLGGLLFAGWWLRRGLFRQFVAVRAGRPEATTTGRVERGAAIVVGALVLGLITLVPAVVKPTKTLPLQVLQDRIPALDPPPLAAIGVESISFEPGAGSVVFTADIKNTGVSPLTVEQLVVGPLSFSARQFGGRGDSELTITPNAAIGPDSTGQVRLTVSSELLRQERLTVGDQTVSRIGGVVIVRNSAGERSWQSVAGDLVRTGG